MPRLPFVVSEPDDVDVVEVVAPLARLQAWAVAAPIAVGHRPITAPSEPKCCPVRGIDGMVLHRIKVVSPDEMTCLECGDTTVEGKCWRCGRGADAALTPMVPTVSYLNPEEYEFTRRTY
jgi:hypothetical protein